MSTPILRRLIRLTQSRAGSIGPLPGHFAPPPFLSVHILSIYLLGLRGILWLFSGTLMLACRERHSTTVCNGKRKQELPIMSVPNNTSPFHYASGCLVPSEHSVFINANRCKMFPIGQIQVGPSSFGPVCFRLMLNEHNPAVLLCPSLLTLARLLRCALLLF